MENRSFRIDYNKDLAALETVLSSMARPGEFYANGGVITPMPRLEIEGVGVVSFPLHPAQVKEIAARASLAPYGRGEQTIVDLEVRKVRQLGTDQFRISGSAWPETLSSIVARAAQALGCDKDKVEAEPYKLLLYEQDGFFVEHRDTEKTPGMFGTLVIVLPSLHSGGDLVVRHAGREVVIDCSTKDISEICYAAFYADCQHEVRPIRTGNRLCLVYNLVRKGKWSKDEIRTPENSAAIAKTAKILTQALDGPAAPLKIVYLLEHDYTPEGLSFAGLKNHDRAIGAVLSGAAARANCAIHLGIVHIEQFGPAQVPYSPRPRGWGRYRGDYDVSENSEYEVIEISESAKYISNWVTSQDEKAKLPQMPLGENELLPNGALDNEPPDEDRVTEATGNEGATFERSYHRAALVLWRNDRFHEVLLQNGVHAALTYFEEMVAQGKQPAEHLREIALAIIDRWACGEQGFRDYLLPKDLGSSRSKMLNLLIQLAAGDLVERFLAEVVVPNYDGSENAALANAATVLPPDQLTSQMQELFQKYGSFQTRVCIELLNGLLQREKTVHGEPLCETFLEALKKPLQAQDSWSRTNRQEIKPTDLAKLYESFHKAGEKQLRSLVKVIVANPKRFPPDDLIPEALKIIARGKNRRGETTTSLWKHAAKYLLQRSENPPAKPTDWARPIKLECTCADCRDLERFADDPVEQVHLFKMRQDRRFHIENTIQQKEIDMQCTTDERGSPKTLVCTKNLASYERQCARHRKDLRWMKTLLELIEESDPEITTINQRMREAINRLHA